MSFPQYPYCEQHDPCGQLPQTVLLFAFAEPQVPSVVTGAEDGEAEREDEDVMLLDGDGVEDIRDTLLELMEL